MASVWRGLFLFCGCRRTGQAFQQQPSRENPNTEILNQMNPNPDQKNVFLHPVKSAARLSAPAPFIFRLKIHYFTVRLEFESTLQPLILDLNAAMLFVVTVRGFIGDAIVLQKRLF